MLVKALVVFGILAYRVPSAAAQPSSASDQAASTSTAAVDQLFSHEASAKLYSFQSKYGTDNATFHKYIKKLDNNAGTIVADGGPWQTYMTKLTDAQVEDVKKQKWYDSIAEVQPPRSDNSDEFRATGASDRQTEGEFHDVNQARHKKAPAERNIIPSAAAQSSSASDQAASTPTSTLTERSSGSAPTKYYGFVSQWGTSPETFAKYIKDLDNNNGTARITEQGPFQMYATRLTDEQVADVKSQPWFESINEFNYPRLDVDEDYRAIDSISTSDQGTGSLNKTVLKRAPGTRSPTLATQLKMISANPNSNKDFGQDYQFDDSLGRGEWIYIVNTGFNLDASDLAPNGRQIVPYVVANTWTLQKYFANPNPLQEPVDENIKDLENGAYPNGHGTGVASAAAGVQYGVASNANLYLIKAKGFLYNSLARSTSAAQYEEFAINDALVTIVNDYKVRRLKRAVVNFSFGLERQFGWNVGSGGTAFPQWKRFLTWCEQNDVVVVAAAGNSGQVQDGPHLGDALPQRLGTPDNTLITVGGLNSDGTLWDKTTPEGPAGVSYDDELPGEYPGSLTVYAKADSVQIMGSKGTQYNDVGTSFAAPAVAGLAAYFYGLATLPDVPNPTYPQGQGARYIKEMISQTAANGGKAVKWVDNLPAANNGANTGPVAPSPVCIAGGTFTLDEANSAVNKFCSHPPWTSANPATEHWQPPQATKRDSTDRTAIYSYSIKKSKDKLVLQMGPTPDGATWDFSEDDCKKWFGVVLNDCNTNTVTQKQGGYLIDGNVYYQIGAEAPS